MDRSNTGKKILILLTTGTLMSGCIMSGCNRWDANLEERLASHESDYIGIEYTESIESNTTENKKEAEAELPTEVATEKPTEPPTEKPTEPPTEKPTEPLTEKPTEEPTEKPTEPPTEKLTEIQTDAPAQNTQKVEFVNTAFLGDSRTEGLNTYATTTGADFYTSIGITIKDVTLKENFLLQDGSYGTMLDAVAQKNYDKIYLMFGINELGWPYKDTFVNYYITAVNTLKQRFPNAKIYLQSILPMVEKRTDEVYNNDKIRLFNTYVEEVALTTGVNYIDVCVSVVDETGALPEESSNDGIHLKKEYCHKWAKYLKEQTAD